MIECGQCGKCCIDLNSPTAPEDLKKIPAPKGMVSLAQCWDYISRNADGKYKYKCRFFNGKGCNIYDRRPEVCRGYPFYGKPIVGKKYALDKDCIFYKYYTKLGGLK